MRLISYRTLHMVFPIIKIHIGSHIKFTPVSLPLGCPSLLISRNEDNIVLPVPFDQ